MHRSKQHLYSITAGNHGHWWVIDPFEKSAS